MEQGVEAVGLGLVWGDGFVGCGDHDTHGWGVCFGLGAGVAGGEGGETFIGEFVDTQSLVTLGCSGVCGGLYWQLSLFVVYGL